MLVLECTFEFMFKIEFISSEGQTVITKATEAFTEPILCPRHSFKPIFCLMNPVSNFMKIILLVFYMRRLRHREVK